MSPGRGAAGLAVLALSVACSPGVGRPPAYPDAEIEDLVDAGRPTPSPDADPPDAGFDRDRVIGLPETGPRPQYPMSGVYQLRDGTFVFAREVGDRLAVVIGGAPYVYVGTIDDNGNVLATGHGLRRAGCVAAELAGVYDRSSATFDLSHRSCSGDGTPFVARIVGAFLTDFDPAISGVYEITYQLEDVGGCHVGPTPPTLRWALNRVQTHVSLFGGEDVADPPGVYLGTLRVEDPFNASLAAIETLAAAPGGLDPSIEGHLRFGAVQDPIVFSGRRDVRVVERACTYGMTFTGTRVLAP